jgi:hypothetical protein
VRAFILNFIFQTGQKKVKDLNRQNGLPGHAEIRYFDNMSVPNQTISKHQNIRHVNVINFSAEFFALLTLPLDRDEYSFLTPDIPYH